MRAAGHADLVCARHSRSAQWTTHRLEHTIEDYAAFYTSGAQIFSPPCVLPGLPGNWSVWLPANIFPHGESAHTRGSWNAVLIAHLVAPQVSLCELDLGA